MADVSASSHSESIVNMAQGSFTGDGTLTNVTLGFVPRRIELINATDRISQLWHEGMPANNTVQAAAAGAQTLETGGLVVPSGDADAFDGFKVAAAAAISAKLIVWTAWG